MSGPLGLAGAWRRRWLGAGLGLALVALGLVGLALGAAWWVPLPERLSTPDSPGLTWRDGSLAWLGLAPDQRWRQAARPEDVDPAFIDALVRLEDRRFWWHPGVDPLAIVRAALLDLRRGRIVSGGSTITMQVARLCEPRPRTLGAKVVEALRALQLELRLDKSQILSAYLTLAPYGGNLEGVRVASLAWFGHSAAHLSPAEIATLLAIPQSPLGRAPSVSNVDRLTQARASVARRLLAAGLLERHLRAGKPVDSDAQDGGQVGDVTPQQVLDRILATPVPQLRQPLPRNVPHVAAWLRSGHGGSARQLNTTLHTTLDAGVQGLAERVVAARAPWRRAHSIADLSVVVVDSASGEVAALVGGSDFWANSPGAQIPSFAVPRSPGSALKPVLYARALDRGLALPETLVVDAPVHYGGYSPENYDGSYDGMVRLEEALSRSLNVPFVRLLQQVGVETFLGDLRDLGVSSLDPVPGHYGLSAIVGGVELTPLELAGIYATLARGGQALPLRWLRNTADVAPRQIWSAGASWLTGRALQRRDRPDFPRRQDLSTAPRFVRWKTGTSFGNRDAWAVGWGRRYTVAVWLGNLNRRPSAWLVGATAAGPLLFDLMDALDDGNSQDPSSVQQLPADLSTVRVCSLSGLPVGAACPHAVDALALRSHVPAQTCQLHRLIELDVATGLRVGPGCREGRDTTTVTRVEWPSSVRRWLSERELSVATVPPLDPACADDSRGQAPRVLSPAAGQVVVLIPGVPAHRQEIPLRAAAGAGWLTWFVDGERVGRSPADDSLWWEPVLGRHQVLVMDEAGRSASAWLGVRTGGDALAVSP